METSVFGQAEGTLFQIAEWVKLGVEAAGVVVIAWGVVSSLIRYGGQLFGAKDQDYIPLRLSLGRYLVVALEFQLAADILGTAVAPDWNSVGKLVVIAVVRTLLNYFLQREIKEEIDMIGSGNQEKLVQRMEE